MCWAIVGGGLWSSNPNVLQEISSFSLVTFADFLIVTTVFPSPLDSRLLSHFRIHLVSLFSVLNRCPCPVGSAPSRRAHEPPSFRFSALTSERRSQALAWAVEMSPQLIAACGFHLFRSTLHVGFVMMNLNNRTFIEHLPAGYRFKD